MKCTGVFRKDEVKRILDSARSIYFIGIGGISMHSLAQIAKMSGRRVSGTDKTASDKTKMLEESGIAVNYTHKGENVDGFDAVVYTAAVAGGCPELSRARELGIPCIKRAEFLGYIMSEYQNRIGVSGMHGKSTATSMLAYIFMEANADPTVLSGAELDILGGASRVGGKEHFLFEACEYTDSFLSFFPSVSVVLNVDFDHPDYFEDMEHILNSFGSYISLAEKAVINADDEYTLLSAERREGNTQLITFGIEKEADYRAENIECRGGRYSFDIIKNGGFFTHISLSVVGRHNVYNALAVCAASDIVGIGADAIASGLAKFKGARRRLEYRGEIDGRYIYDDYAHHPFEIKATLGGMKDMTQGRLWCIFQPHTYSRTAELFDEFSSALEVADGVVLVDIYAARETNTYGVTSKALAEKTGGAIYAQSFEAAAEKAMEISAQGDIIVTMGAGDVYKVFEL